MTFTLPECPVQPEELHRPLYASISSIVLYISLNREKDNVRHWFVECVPAPMYVNSDRALMQTDNVNCIRQQAVTIG